MNKSYRSKVVCYSFLWLTAAHFIYDVRTVGVAKQQSQPILRPSSTYSKTLLKSQPAKVTHSKVSLAELQVAKVRGPKSLTTAHFLDEKNGWVAERNLLFRTTDGGRDWQKQNINVPSEASISSVFFINDQLGWVSIVKERHGTPFGQEYSSSLLLTSDGGNTWAQKAAYPDGVEISYLKFLNEGEGIATGNRIVPSNPRYPEMFVISTKDGGDKWTDISQKVNAAISDEYGKANDFGADVSWESPGRLLLLTPLGRIVSSSDEGDTWQTLTQLTGGYGYQTTYRKIHVSERGTIRVIGGLTGDEGAWGDLTLQNEENTWRSYELLRVPILDAISVSEDEIIVCGGEARVGIRNRLGPFVGIILRSSDAGKTWSVIYKSAITESFFSLTKVDEYRYYALSDAGTLVRFTLNH
jgi:photosystem II stability/assembly factor-like uncharacterized protein